MNNKGCLEVIGMTELIDKSLTPLCFLHDPFLVILTKGSGEFVIVHGWTVLSFAPQSGHLDGINNLEDALWPVNPVDVVSIQVRLHKQFLDELPQMDVSSRPRGRFLRGFGLLLFLIFIFLHRIDPVVAANGSRF